LIIFSKIDFLKILLEEFWYRQMNNSLLNGKYWNEQKKTRWSSFSLIINQQSFQILIWSSVKTIVFRIDWRQRKSIEIFFRFRNFQGINLLPDDFFSFNWNLRQDENELSSFFQRLLIELFVDVSIFFYTPKYLLEFV